VFLLIVGAGVVGSNLTRSMVARGTEVVLVEQSRARCDELAAELGYRIEHGDATELYVLERAGIARPPDIVVAATGDDEDNIVVCQLSRERYGVPKVIARVNDPRNQPHFDLLGISPTVSAARTMMALIEHEVPEHELVHLLELPRQNLEIVEIEILDGSPAAGKRVEQLRLPESTRLISVMREDGAEIAVGSTRLRVGDQVLAILQPGAEDDLRALLLEPSGRGLRRH
jgi:trk system potassium uptake protein TrkA